MLGSFTLLLVFSIMNWFIFQGWQIDVFLNIIMKSLTKMLSRVFQSIDVILTNGQEVPSLVSGNLFNLTPKSLNVTLMNCDCFLTV
jgi:hypothetical protein